jgi:hypothetical protein
MLILITLFLGLWVSLLFWLGKVGLDATPPVVPEDGGNALLAKDRLILIEVGEDDVQKFVKQSPEALLLALPWIQLDQGNRPVVSHADRRLAAHLAIPQPDRFADIDADLHDSGWGETVRTEWGIGDRESVIGILLLTLTPRPSSLDFPKIAS